MIGTTINHRVGVAVFVVICTASLCAYQSPASTHAAEPSIRQAHFQVGNEVLTVDIVVSASAAKSVVGAIRLVVTLPAGQTGALLDSDAGFNGKGWQVSFRRGRDADVGRIIVTVNARQSQLAVEVDLSSDAGWAYGVPGRANVATIVEFYPSFPGLPGPVA